MSTRIIDSADPGATEASRNQWSLSRRRTACLRVTLTGAPARSSSRPRGSRRLAGFSPRMELEWSSRSRKSSNDRQLEGRSVSKGADASRKQAGSIGEDTLDRARNRIDWFRVHGTQSRRSRTRRNGFPCRVRNVVKPLRSRVRMFSHSSASASRRSVASA